MARLQELWALDKDAVSPGIEARLLVLSSDPDVEVRRATIAQLAMRAHVPSLRARLLAMIGDESREVARKAVLDARYACVSPSAEELDEALASDNAFVTHWMIVLASEMPTLERLLDAVRTRPSLYLVILPRLVERLAEERVRSAFLAGLASPLVDVQACAYRTLIARSTAAAEYPELRAALLGALEELPEIMRPTFHKLAGEQPS